MSNGDSDDIFIHRKNLIVPSNAGNPFVLEDDKLLYVIGEYEGRPVGELVEMDPECNKVRVCVEPSDINLDAISNVFKSNRRA